MGRNAGNCELVPFLKVVRRAMSGNAPVSVPVAGINPVTGAGNRDVRRAGAVAVRSIAGAFVGETVHPGDALEDSGHEVGGVVGSCQPVSQDG